MKEEPQVLIPLKEYNDLISCREALQNPISEIKAVYSIRKETLLNKQHEYIHFFNETDAMQELFIENKILRDWLDFETKRAHDNYNKSCDLEKKLKNKKFLGFF